MRSALFPRLLTLILALGLTAGACTGEDGAPPPTPTGGSIAAEVASADLYVGTPQRFLVGLLAPDNRFVSFGRIDLSFSYTGTEEAPVDGVPGPQVEAGYIPTPGTPETGSGPAFFLPHEARGVYQATGISFDRAGFWEVLVRADIRGEGEQTARATFPVLEAPALPAPGQPALRTDNLTNASKDAPEAAIDSRAADGGGIPDPELHEWTIARAVAEHRPALVTFGTPLFCTSKLCGPVTEEVERLARRYADRAVFIHIEIWRDFEKGVINRAAADWLLRNNDLTEPWLYLIGPDGMIADRWGVLWDPGEVAAALEQLPPTS